MGGIRQSSVFAQPPYPPRPPHIRGTLAPLSNHLVPARLRAPPSPPLSILLSVLIYLTTHPRPPATPPPLLPLLTSKWRRTGAAGGEMTHERRSRPALWRKSRSM